MAAKKNIIKELRLEIKDLEDKVKGQRQHINYRERQFNRIENGHKNELAAINRRTNSVANILQYRFSKDLSWLALTDDSESKFQHVKDAIEILHHICAPVEDFTDE